MHKLNSRTHKMLLLRYAWAWRPAFSPHGPNLLWRISSLWKVCRFGHLSPLFATFFQSSGSALRVLIYTVLSKRVGRTPAQPLRTCRLRVTVGTLKGWGRAAGRRAAGEGARTGAGAVAEAGAGAAVGGLVAGHVIRWRVGRVAATNIEIESSGRKQCRRQFFFWLAQ